MADEQQQQNTNVPEDLIPTADDAEWGQVTSDFAKDHGFDPAGPVKEKQDDKAGDDDKGTGGGDNAAAGTGSDDDAGKKDDDAKGDDDQQQQVQDNPAVREARQVQREIQEDREAIVKDIREQMFEGAEEELTDADGDPIRTIEDVQKHLNPKTGKPFTDEEAAMWLMGAQKHFNEQKATREKQVEEVAEVNLDLRDQADAVRTKWGSLLKELDKEQPGFSKNLWLEYAKSFTVDADSKLITKAPVSMERFYDTALAGYAKAADLAKKQADEAAKQQQEQTRNQTRNDRSDIYGGGDKTPKDQEEDEWAQAAKAVYER